MGWSSFAAALAQEDNVRLRLNELPAQRRAVRVVAYTIAGQRESNTSIVAGELKSLRDVATATRLVQVWHSISPPDPTGTRVVVAPGGIVVERGRRPRGCYDMVCEALALRGRYRLGQVIRLSESHFVGSGLRREYARVRIVGFGELRPDVRATAADLGRHAIVVASLNRRLRKLVEGVGSTITWTAPLDPRAAHGFNLRQLSERLRNVAVRIDRDTDPNNPAQARAPLALLEGLADRGDASRSRLLLIGGEAAALLVAFAAFGASARRRDVELGDEQLATLGATRVQTWSVRVTEALLPSLAGVIGALVGLFVAAEVVARARSLPEAFVPAALPGRAILVIVAVGVASTLLLLLVATPRRPRYGLGALELAAVVAVALLAWQTAATGALDPSRVAASGANPLLVLMPGLLFFASAVVLLRTLPILLRLGERLARRGAFPLRLALLTAARSPAQAAAMTTFLAVALGAALFSLDYRETLNRQSHDQAEFAAGAAWRVIERNPARPYGRGDVTPLTRFTTITRERPTPVIRLDARLPNINPSIEPLRVQLLAIPVDRLKEVRGWRAGFAGLTRGDIAHRLRPRPLRLHGAPIADADGVRLWVRSDTEAPRIVVLHFVLPGQRFSFLRLGLVHERWRLLQAPLPPSLRGGELVGLEFLPTEVPLTHELDYAGEVDVADVSVRRRRRWTPLPSVNHWIAATPFVGSHSGLVQYGDFVPGPVKRGLQFELSGTLRPLIRPPLTIPKSLPALVGRPVAAAAVDGTVALDIGDRTVSLRVVGRSSLFPTVVARPSQFALVDYDTLFAALNADQPGAVVPSEAWFFGSQPAGAAASLARRPFRVERLVAAEPLKARLLADPLAVGTRRVLLVAGVAAAILGLLGLILSARAALQSERLVTAEYEALGVEPPALSHAAQLRLVVLSAVGIAAAFVGALLAVRIIGAFVAVTSTGARPLPPIVVNVAWTDAAVVLVAVGSIAVAAVRLLVGRVFRETTATRLRS